jgi:glycosyltransferase involved in cell wall biosynthesis
MKICHIINSYPLPTGGMQTYCYDLSRKLSEYDNDVQILVSGNICKSKPQGKFKIVRLKPWFSIGKATFSPSLIINLLRNNFDVIHIHLPFHFGFEIALLVAKIKNIPVVITYHCEANNYKDNLIKEVIMRSYNVFNNFLLNYVDHIIFTTEDYSKLFNFDNSKKSVIPIGVDINRFKVLDRNASRKHTKLPKSKYIILFVGNLDTHNYYKKGVGYLLDAIPLIREKIPNIFVNLVGVTDTETKNTINVICKDNEISDIVRISGYVSSKDLPRHYASSNVFVLPSVSKLEAFGIVLLEAMASGLPIVASNIPGVRSVVKCSKAGFLVRPKSSQDIATCIVDIARLKNLDKYALETVKKKYSWNQIVIQISEIYRNVIKI